MPVSFDSIHPYRGSQSAAFEELVCQIVRRMLAPDDATWRRLDGAGGDGGVEAYFDTARGRLGLQAKYFLRTADIGWRQIRDSFAAALDNHPTLIEYRIYLACDLTGPTRRGGQTGTDRWAALEQEMLQLAAARGRAVAIVLVTAADIDNELARPQCIGLVAHWFGALEITNRLAAWLELSTAALGARYHPEDHVGVAAEHLTRVLSRSAYVEDALQRHAAAIAALPAISVPDEWRTDEEALARIAAVNRSRDLAADLRRDLAAATVTWPVLAWRVTLRTARQSVDRLWQQTFSAGGGVVADGITPVRQKVNSYLQVLDALHTELHLAGFDAEIDRAGVVIGPAGAGKSHLLAACAKDVLADGGICLLLLGQRFTQEQLWPQIIGQLGLPATTSVDEFLGALDAAAIAARRRALIVIDAVNEGSLRRVWRQEFDAFAHHIRRYSNLALAVSCRDVFVPQVLGSDVRTRFAVTTIEGFATSAEQERAAQVYMDRRGITRPAVPWLAPEFVNPLFLRGCCDAIAAEDGHEFPTGLIGTKRLLDFYVTALSHALMLDVDVPGDIARPCKRAITTIARQMASNRLDWLERSQAAALIVQAFAGFGAASLDWTAALLRSGLLREDPHPDNDPKDPLSEKPDVVRFAFQRFQDHLMAEALLEGVADVGAAFAADGVFAFLYGKRGHLLGDWNGLVEALAIQVPEQFGFELIDLLAGGPERHWNSYAVQQAFIASVRWREGRAINARTLELANTLNDNPGALLALLIELAPRVEHPWNAHLLDKQLRRWKGWVRDRNFAVVISREGLYADHPVNRLIDWCATAPKAKADAEALKLCAVTLSWLTASLAPALRDRATKALASLLTDAPSLLPDLIAQFALVDDLYVVERVLAAAYGMLQRHGTTAHCETAACAVLTHIFGQRPVPENLLVRDYAAGIVELSRSQGGLADLDISAAVPPYGSPEPNFRLKRSAVEALATRAGGDDILRHSTKDFYDFYKNDIRHRVEEFTRVRLTTPLPPNNRQLAFQFEVDLKLQSGSAKWQALSILNERIWSRNTVKIVGWLTPPASTPARPKATLRQVRTAETQLLALLTPDEAHRYHENWLPRQTGKDVDFSKVAKQPAPAAGLWIAREAYRMGWTEARFGQDHGDGDSDYSEQPTIERVGKKYQWLARSKLLCRLADNFWIVDNFDDSRPKAYRYITDIDFERDIDPTLYAHPSHQDDQAFGRDLGLLAPPPMIAAQDNEARFAWPLAFDFESMPVDNPFFVDRTGEGWARLSWYVSGERHGEEPKNYSTHNLLQREFRFTHAVLCEPAEAPRLQTALHAASHIDVPDWDPIEYTDGPFLYEFWRGNWRSQQWRAVTHRIGRAAARVAFPVEECRWESHLDRTLPDGGRGRLLAPWIMGSERLRLSAVRQNCIEDANGQVVAWNSSWPDNIGLVVRRSWLEVFLRRANLACVWLTVGEREAWADDEDRGALVYRRFNSVVRQDNSGLVATRWYEDTDARPRVPIA
jgi:hypothetical protein